MGIPAPVLKLFWKNTERGDQKRLATQSAPAGVTEICDIPYIDDDKWQHKLDVYFPENMENEKLPVIIDIHGGGWMYGDKELNKYYNMVLASKGFTVFSMSYTLWPETTVPEQLKEIAEALLWIKNNISSYPCDKSKIMLTGDSESGAKAGAKALGITEYRSQVLPEDKSRIVEELKAEGKTVIMVGDGINDSPALAAADVSVSMKHSSDIAREVADISLLSDDLYDLVTLRKLSVGMLDKINTNYRNIVAVNGSLLVLGVLGVIPPSTSSMIHNLSTMIFGVLSTKSVLNNSDIEAKAIEVADAS
jgi:hypothetical protein